MRRTVEEALFRTSRFSSSPAPPAAGAVLFGAAAATVPLA